MLRSLHLLASAFRYCPMAKVGVIQAVKRSACLRLLCGTPNAVFAASSAGCFTHKPMPTGSWLQLWPS